MRSVIYKTTNLINGKQYIGQQIIYDKKYLGSGKLLIRAIKKYGKQSFRKEILENCINISQKELDDKEKYWIEKYDAVDDKNFYNLSLGGLGGCVRNNDNFKIYQFDLNCNLIKEWKSLRELYLETGYGSTRILNNINRLKKSAYSFRWTKEKDLTEEYRYWLTSNGHTGHSRKMNDEGKRRLSIANTGNKHTEETRIKMSLSHKGKILSESHRNKISNSLCSREISNETKIKLSQSNLHKHQKNSYYILQYDKNYKLIEVYNNIQHASDVLGITRHLILKGVFEDYILVRKKELEDGIDIKLK